MSYHLFNILSVIYMSIYIASCDKKIDLITTTQSGPLTQAVAAVNHRCDDTPNIGASLLSLPYDGLVTKCNKHCYYYPDDKCKAFYVQFAGVSMIDFTTNMYHCLVYTDVEYPLKAAAQDGGQGCFEVIILPPDEVNIECDADCQIAMMSQILAEAITSNAVVAAMNGIGQEIGDGIINTLEEILSLGESLGEGIGGAYQDVEDFFDSLF
eukprot:19806_1